MLARAADWQAFGVPMSGIRQQRQARKHFQGLRKKLPVSIHDSLLGFLDHGQFLLGEDTLLDVELGLGDAEEGEKREDAHEGVKHDGLVR